MARRYPFAACEVLCCEVDAIFSALLDDPALLARLFGFLDAAGPLDCVRAGFFARSVTCLLMRRHADVMRYLQTAPAVLDRLVAHVDTTSIAEVTGGHLCPLQRYIMPVASWSGMQMQALQSDREWTVLERTPSVPARCDSLGTSGAGDGAAGGRGRADGDVPVAGAVLLAAQHRRRRGAQPPCDI